MRKLLFVWVLALLCALPCMADDKTAKAETPAKKSNPNVIERVLEQDTSVKFKQDVVTYLEKVYSDMKMPLKVKNWPDLLPTADKGKTTYSYTLGVMSPSKEASDKAAKRKKAAFRIGFTINKSEDGKSERSTEGKVNIFLVDKDGDVVYKKAVASKDTCPS